MEGLLGLPDRLPLPLDCLCVVCVHELPRYEKASRTRGRGKPTRLAPRCFLLQRKQQLHRAHLSHGDGRATSSSPRAAPSGSARAAPGRAWRRSRRRARSRCPTSLTITIDEVANAPTATQKRSAADCDDPAGPFEPERDRLPVLEPRVVRLLDPREQEDAIVGGEPERDREEERRLGQLERALAAVVQERPPAARPGRSGRGAERRREAEHVHHERLQRQHHRPRDERRAARR